MIRVPVAQDLRGVDPLGFKRRGYGVAGGDRGLVAENMGVTPHQLGVDAGDYLGDGEGAGFARHLRVEKHLQQQVAQFFTQIGPVAALDGVEDLVGFFQRVFADGVEGLLPVPRASSGPAELRHDADRSGELSRGV